MLYPRCSPTLLPTRSQRFCTPLSYPTRYIKYNENKNQYNANSYYWEYMAENNNNNNQQSTSGQKYSYGSQYYGYGYWDSTKQQLNQQNYQKYQQYQQKSQYKSGSNENYSYASQNYGYGSWNANNNQQSSSNQNSYQNNQQQQTQQQQYSGSGENYAYGYQDYGYGYNHGGRRLLQGYKKVDCYTCEDFQCFAGMEKATEEEMAAYQQQEYENWQAAQAEDVEGQEAEGEGEEADVDGQEEQADNGAGRRAEEVDEEAAAEQEEDVEGEYAVDTETIAEWVSSVAGCEDTGALLDESWPLYAGFMCNEDGSGVEIGLFLDEECSVYTTRQSYANVASEYDQAYMHEAEGLITYTFLNDIDCNGDLTYLSFQEWMEMQQTYQANNQNAAYEYGEASEYCAGLFEGGAVSLHDCNQDGEEDEVDENSEVEIYAYDYYWYTYALSYADSVDAAATCSVIQNMQGEYTPVYSWKQSGQLYNYGTSLSKWDTAGIRSFFGASDEMGKVLVAAIVLSVLFAVFSCFCVLWSCCGKGRVRSRKQVLQEEDPKKQELIDSSTGNMLQ